MRPRGPTCGACYQRRVRDPSIGLQWSGFASCVAEELSRYPFTGDSSAIAGLPSVLNMPRWSRPTDSDPHRLCRNQIATIHPGSPTCTTAAPPSAAEATPVHPLDRHTVRLEAGGHSAILQFRSGAYAALEFFDSPTWWSSESAGAPATGPRCFRREVWAAWPEPSSCRPARESDSSK